MTNMTSMTSASSTDPADMVALVESRTQDGLLEEAKRKLNVMPADMIEDWLQHYAEVFDSKETIEEQFSVKSANDLTNEHFAGLEKGTKLPKDLFWVAQAAVLDGDRGKLAILPGLSSVHPAFRAALSIAVGQYRMELTDRTQHRTAAIVYKQALLAENYIEGVFNGTQEPDKDTSNLAARVLEAGRNVAAGNKWHGIKRSRSEVQEMIKGPNGATGTRIVTREMEELGSNGNAAALPHHEAPRPEETV